ncbi:EamA family transporter [Gordonia sp. SID5947]|uniref:DMT family transporter n=1 Tax=Gordonia sp. SID5947 TaxID=2690315 RepID=UPI00136E3FEA|nr:DMT family transporter [Gordonia sp. SID5947]MYR07150.1 EamA family transporter [Gordonia sp. SID5947]
MRTSPIGIPTRPAPSAWLSAGLSILFVASWSSGFIGAKLGASDAPATTLLMWRFIPVALALSAVAALLARRSPAPRRTRRGAMTQIGVGALSQCGYTLTVYWAIGLGVSTGTTALIDGVQPLVVAVLAGPLLGAAASGRQWFGLTVGAIGVVIVTWTDATASTTAAPWWAYLIPLAGMASLVAATFLDRRGPNTLSRTESLAIHCTTSAVIFTAICLVDGTAMPPAAPGFWVAIGWLIGLSTLGGYGLYWILVDRLGVTSVNALMFLMPPVTTLWGAAMFGEPLTATTIVGLTVALGATITVVRVGKRREQCPDRPSRASENPAYSGQHRPHPDRVGSRAESEVS